VLDSPNKNPEPKKKKGGEIVRENTNFATKNTQIIILEVNKL